MNACSMMDSVIKLTQLSVKELKLINNYKSQLFCKFSARKPVTIGGVNWIQSYLSSRHASLNEEASFHGGSMNG